MILTGNLDTTRCLLLLKKQFCLSKRNTFISQDIQDILLFSGSVRRTRYECCVWWRSTRSRRESLLLPGRRKLFLGTKQPLNTSLSNRPSICMSIMAVGSFSAYCSCFHCPLCVSEHWNPVVSQVQAEHGREGHPGGYVQPEVDRKWASGASPLYSQVGVRSNLINRRSLRD